MAFVAPIIVVLGPYCGGTSAVAGVLNHLGVFMGTEFSYAFRELGETWEESALHRLCTNAFREPRGELIMAPSSLETKLRSWADDHRRAASAEGRPPGVKLPMLCVAIDFIRAAWGPIVPVVVDRPLANVVASLNRLGWFADEQERAESTAGLIAARDRALAGAATVRVDFEALCSTPADEVRRLVDELCLEVTEDQIAAAVRSVVHPVNESRGADNVDPYQSAIDRWLREVERNPEDKRLTFFLAQAYYLDGDYLNARKWFARQLEMGGFSDEETYFAMLRIAQSIAQLDTPWSEVQDAYLRAWQFRPIRAEALYFLALQCRIDKRYQLGHLFASRAAQIPLPEGDTVFVRDVPTWCATEEQATCAWFIGNQAEAFTLYRRLLARPDLPDEGRQRIAGNRDFSVPAMLDAASSYPDVLVGNLVAGPRDAEVTVTLVAGPDHAATEQTLNSFLHCCTDVSRVGRFLVIDGGLAAQDRAKLLERYGFLEFAETDAGAEIAQIREQIHGRFWLHLGHNWRFFAPENLITRLTAVLDAEPQVFQVGINFADAVALTGANAAEPTVRRTPDAGRYVLTSEMATGPAMFDTVRLDAAGRVEGTVTDPIAAMRTASLDEVLCVAAS
jgi:tetratricopeptide (TPR) repeat protein